MSQITSNRQFSEGEKCYLTTHLLFLLKQWESPSDFYSPIIDPEEYRAISEEIKDAYPLIKGLDNVEKTDFSGLESTNWQGIRNKILRLEQLYTTYQSNLHSTYQAPEPKDELRAPDPALREHIRSHMDRVDIDEVLLELDIARLENIKISLDCPTHDFKPHIRPLISEAKIRIRALCTLHDEAYLKSIDSICGAVNATYELTIALKKAKHPDPAPLLELALIALGQILYEDDIC